MYNISAIGWIVRRLLFNKKYRFKATQHKVMYEEKRLYFRLIVFIMYNISDIGWIVRRLLFNKKYRFKARQHKVMYEETSGR